LSPLQVDAIKNMKIDKVVVWDGGNGQGDSEHGGAIANFLFGLVKSPPPLREVAEWQD
jgi:flotillin